MKTINLLRHAKSSWSDPLLEDIDRPLNQRGEKAARFMAAQIAATGCRFDHIYCSPARRAVGTIELIAGQLGDRKLHWQIEESLYTFDHQQLLDWLTRVDDSIDELLVVGHNPALTRLCNTIGNGCITNIPTCGFVRMVATDTTHWQNLTDARFHRSLFITPKKSADSKSLD